MHKNARAFTQSHDGIVLRIISDIIVCQRGGDTWRKVSALWDTGATICCIDGMTAKMLGLKMISKKTVSGVHGNQDVNCYLVDIVLPNNITIKDLEVVEGDLKNEDFIIGMNVLKFGDFCLSNYQGKTVMTFMTPSQKTTDYVKEWNIRYHHGKATKLKKS